MIVTDWRRMQRLRGLCFHLRVRGSSRGWEAGGERNDPNNICTYEYMNKEKRRRRRRRRKRRRRRRRRKA
jgi:hypothetical protein